MTPVELRAAVQVRPYRDDDEPSVIELLRLTLGGGPSGERSEEFFRWKHLENPAGRSFMLVAELDGQIVGFRAFMRWRFVAGGSTLRAVRAVDTATHPDHQGKGVFSTLTLRALEDLRRDTDLVFNTPNAISLQGYLKMGWRTVGRMPVWIRVRKPLTFAQGLRSIGSLGEPSRSGPEVHAPPATDLFERSQDLSDLLEFARTSDARIATPVDLEYLTWRYGHAAFLGYRAITERSDGRATGVAFFRVRPRGDLWETTLADVIVAPGDRRTARRLIRRVVAASPVDHVTCHFPAGSPHLNGARRNGFLRWRRGEVLVVNTLNPDLPTDVTRPEGWSLSLGTLEVF
jgi:GNAT superfamily N-acetyltransferase